MPKDNSPEKLNTEIEVTSQELERERILDESVSKRAEEVLEQKESPLDELNSLDLEISPEEQPEAFNALEAALLDHTFQLLKSGDFNVEKAKTNFLYFISFAKPEGQLEKTALSKLMKLTEAPQARASKWLERFPQELEEYAKLYEQAVEEKESIEKNKKPAWKEMLGKIPKGVWIAAGAIGGVYVTSKLLSARKSTNNGTAIKYTTGALSAALIGHQLLFNEKVDKWISKNMGISLSWGTLKKAAPLLISGEWKEAWQIIRKEIKETNPFVAKTAEKINVLPENLSLAMDEPYEEFTSTGTSANRKIEELSQTLLPDVDLPFITSKEEKERQLNDEQLIAAYLNKNKEILSKADPQPETVGEALKYLDTQNGVITPELKEEPSNQESDEKLPENIAPTATAAMNEWLDNGAKPSEAGEFAKKAIEGAKKDGAALVVSDGGILLYKAGAIVSYLILAPVAETFITTMEELISGDMELGNIVETYWDSAGGYFIMAGAVPAVSGALKSFHTGGPGPFIEGLKAGAKTSVTPFRGTWWATKKAVGVTIDAKGVYYKAGEIFTPDMHTKAEYAHSRVKHNAARFRRYYKIKHSDNELLKKAIGKKNLDNLIQYYGEKFANSQHKLHKLVGLPGKEPKAWTPDSHGDGHIKRAEKYLAKGEWDELSKIILPEDQVKLRAESIASKKGGKAAEHLDDARDLMITEKLQPKASTFKGTFEHLELPDRIILKELGLTDEAIQWLDEMKLTDTELDELMKQLDPEKVEDALRTKRLRRLEYMTKEIQRGSLMEKAKPLIKVAGVIGAATFIYGLEHADDPADYLARTVASGSGFLAGATLTTKYTAGKISNPLLQLGVSTIGGLVTALGIDVVWNDTGGYWMKKYAPNLSKNKYLSQGVEGLVESQTFGMAGLTEYAWENYVRRDRVTAETDPIEYLSDSYKTIRRTDEEGWDKSIFEDRPIHEESADLIPEAVRTRKELEEKLNTLPDQNTAEAKEITKQIEKLSLIISGKWVNAERLKIMSMEASIVNPSIEGFYKLASARFGAEGAERFNHIVNRIGKGMAPIKVAKEQQVWEFIIGQSVDLPVGQVSFTDFLTQYHYVSQRKRFLNKHYPVKQSKDPLAELESIL